MEKEDFFPEKIPLSFLLGLRSVVLSDTVRCEGGAARLRFARTTFGPPPPICPKSFGVLLAGSKPKAAHHSLYAAGPSVFKFFLFF